MGSLQARSHHRSWTAGIYGSLAIDVSSSDQTLAITSRGLYVGVEGNVTLRLVDDDADAVFTAMAPGYYPFAVNIVRTSGTTATGLVALY